MKFEQQVDESEMVALFLQSEIKSKRWADTIREVLTQCSLPVTLITAPDLSDPVANRQRAMVLGRFRGYPEDRGLFAAYPDDVNWHRVLVERNDFRRLKYIDYSYWNELTGGSRRPLDAAATILKGKEIFCVSNRPAMDGAEAVRAGATFDPIILVAPTRTSDLVILEGHLRTTAYALAGSKSPDEIRALLGISSSFDSWI